MAMTALAPEPLPLRVADLRQLLYCERIPVLSHRMDRWPRETRKQIEGRLEQAAIELLETRRSLARYGVCGGAREFHVALESEALGLAGVVDMVVRAPAGVFPVEFKMTESGVRAGHRMQAAAYAMLLEEREQVAVSRAFVYLIPTKDVVAVEVDGAMRAEVRAAVERVRALVASVELPPPPGTRGKCVECEFRNFCGDVW